MRKQAHGTWVNDQCFHVETELGIINIYVGLQDTEGHKVESVEIIPDKVNHQVLVEGSDYHRVRLIEVSAH